MPNNSNKSYPICILSGIRKKQRRTTASMALLLKKQPVHLRDVFSATGHDPDHSEDEERFVTFGISSQGRLLTVSHTDRGNAIRIISARLATNVERQIYEEG